jgi:hypothetical protein
VETIEYSTLDKSKWQRGPWDAEPDKVQWRDEATGLPCLAVRGPVGAWCGYVGVPPGHPWHGKEYDACQTAERDEWGCSGPFVHGGLTFSGACSHGDPAHSICHVPGRGEPDDVWWLGFDCAHSGDYTDMKCDDAWLARFPPRGDVYRDLDYVRREAASLAAQAASAGETRSAETNEDSARPAG